MRCFGSHWKYFVFSHMLIYELHVSNNDTSLGQLSVLPHKVSTPEKHLISYSRAMSICASKLLNIKQCITNTNVCKNSPSLQQSSNNLLFYCLFLTGLNRTLAIMNQFQSKAIETSAVALGLEARILPRMCSTLPKLYIQTNTPSGKAQCWSPQHTADRQDG